MSQQSSHSQQPNISNTQPLDVPQGAPQFVAPTPQNVAKLRVGPAGDPGMKKVASEPSFNKLNGFEAPQQQQSFLAAAQVPRHFGATPVPAEALLPIPHETSNPNLHQLVQPPPPSFQQFENMEGQPPPPMPSAPHGNNRSALHHGRYPTPEQQKYPAVQQPQQYPQQQQYQGAPPQVNGQNGGYAQPPPPSHQQQAPLSNSQHMYPQAQSQYQQPRPDSRPQPPPHIPPLQLDQSLSSSRGSGGSGVGFDPQYSVINLLQVNNPLPQENQLETPRPVLPPDVKKTACNPEIFRCTLNAVPATSSILGKCRLPLALLLHPYKDTNGMPVVNTSVIVRCKSCRSYINPFVSFVDRRRWRCNLCTRLNDLPDEFYRDLHGGHSEPAKRPELHHGTIEYIAPSDYMLRPPQPATYAFLFDVSAPALQTGYLHVISKLMTETLSRLPGDSRKQVVFMAYDTRLHFFNLSEDLTQPGLMTAPDIEDPFVPMPDGLLVNLEDSRPLIEAVLAELPEMFKSQPMTGCSLGAALQSAVKLLTPIGGRITVFQAGLPNVGPGALLPRDGKQLDKNSIDINEATDFYKSLAIDCSQHQLTIDMVLMPHSYCDVATIATAARYSGGSVFYYPGLHVGNAVQVNKFKTEITRYLTRNIGFEAVMRIRCSRGLSIKQFYGNCFVRSTDLITLPNVNPDAGFVVTLNIEDDISDQFVSCQAALLYTSSKGERRIRVHTLCMPSTNQLSEIFTSADQVAIAGTLARLGVEKSFRQGLADAREAFINAAVDALSAYATTQQQSSRFNALNTSHQLRLVPLYVLALIKSPAFLARKDLPLDTRSFAIEQANLLPCSQFLLSIHPSLYVLTRGKPTLCMLSVASLDSTAVFLLDQGHTFWLWIGLDTPSNLMQSMFGVNRAAEVPSGALESLPNLETEENQYLRDFVDYLNSQRSTNPPLVIARSDSGEHQIFRELLIADRTESTMSYPEFLQYLQKEMKS